jgi:catechol 2,3-dioxygenase-like lactoylglutathione lyase family enzyme
MAKVLGLGGVFVKSRDPVALRAWYRDKLGVEIADWGGTQLSPPPGSHNVWAAFGDDTKYFEPSPHRVMINFLVEDLAGLLAQLRVTGARVLDRTETSPEGAFGYVLDPDDTLLELWEPAPKAP